MLKIKTPVFIIGLSVGIVVGILCVITIFFLFLKQTGKLPSYKKHGDVIVRADRFGSYIENFDNSKISETFSVISQISGFHAYYPTYFPEKYPINEKSIAVYNVSKDPTVNYYLGNGDISIMQSKSKNLFDNDLWEKKDYFEIQQEVNINSNIGYIGIREGLGKDNAKIISHHLLIKTDTNTVIYFRTKYYGQEFDPDILIKIAESLR